MSITIGKIIEDSQERDAIHVAVAPVTAYCELQPGEHIGFIKDDNRTVSNLAGQKIGIVDPYLSKTIQKGQQFWMFLYPNTIISLRHDWTHPSFEANIDKIEEAKKWITDWALQYGMTYDRAMECGKQEDFFVEEVVYDQVPPDFWVNFEIITGHRVSSEVREGTYFHCAC